MVIDPLGVDNHPVLFIVPVGRVMKYIVRLVPILYHIRPGFASSIVSEKVGGSRKLAPVPGDVMKI